MNEKMKSAEEVAEEIYWKVHKSTNELDWKQLFAKALTAFVEERVKELNDDLRDVMKDNYEEARAEALEEAEKIAEEHGGHGCECAYLIRALKEKI